jgi:DNA sulfur modification protein DndE
VAFAFTTLSLAACPHAISASVRETPNAARATVEEAYIYGYLLVLLDVTRAKLTNVPHPMGAGLAPVDQFGNIKTFPHATFTDVVSPNAGTL